MALAPARLLLQFVVAAVCCASLGDSLNNGLAQVPIRGYQSWNDLGPQVSEAKLKDRAFALISTGMAKLNYSYVCIDDIWAAASRDPSNGTLIPDPARFPSGMRALSDWMHQRGLKVRRSPIIISSAL